MESVAISVENVSKKFRLFKSHKERLLEALHPFNKKYHREFWALRDISFNVPKGITIGIIGRNGSGKSTLLKVICSILKPTSGVVKTNGKISSLLSFGAGFNPRFTGRDNVLMNGVLMGFSAEEMKKRLPVIEAFADIGEFINQPVKIYSSGMFVRLAFAAAINVDPDILVMDEVLAVGDAKFRRKCFQKFDDFQQAGKTIVLVTHAQEVLVRHCSYAVLLEKGRSLMQGDPKDVSNRYNELLFELDSLPKVSHSQRVAARQAGKQPADHSKRDEVPRFLREVPQADNCVLRRSYNANEHRFGDGRAKIIDYLIVRNGDTDPVAVQSGDLVDVYVKVRYYQDVETPTFGINVKTVDGVVVYGNSTVVSNIQLASARRDEVRVVKAALRLSLHSGHYFFSLAVGERTDGKTQVLDGRDDLVHIVLEEQRRFGGLADLGMTLDEVASINDVVTERQLPVDASCSGQDRSRKEFLNGTNRIEKNI